MIANNPQKIGTVDGVDVVVNATSGGLTDAPLVRITLTKDYDRRPPFGWLEATPPGSPVAENLTIGPRLIPAGTVLDLTAAEAGALVELNAATAD